MDWIEYKKAYDLMWEIDLAINHSFKSFIEFCMSNKAMVKRIKHKVRNRR